MDKPQVSVKAIFDQALEIESPAERTAYLDKACAASPELRAKVEALLIAYAEAGSFLESPAPVPTVDSSPGLSPVKDAAASPLPEGPGSRIGPYKLLQKLGEGGMGTVWVAEQTEPVKRRVALKVIKPGMDSAQVLRRFEAERQALALMDHTHIAKVFDAGTTPEGRPYFVMELVKGAPITKYCDELHLPIRERLELFVPVCQAIQHAHQKGIIHRDVKPSNVLVAIQDGKPVAKVIDFGVAKALHQRLTEESVYTEIGQMVGTLEYMSPEQAELSVLDIDTRADIYALGALLYELLTGSTPLDRKRLHSAAFAEMLRLIKEEEPPRPSTRLTQSKESLASLAARRRTEPAKLTRLVRGELDWIVMKCLEKDRTRRYDTANNLARDVERYLHDEPVEACPPSAGYRLRKFSRKYRIPLTVAAAFALLLMTGIVVSTWQAVRATRAEGEAVVQKDLAKDAEREATKKREEAEAAREQARTAETRLHRLYYSASMGVAQAAWENHNLSRVRDLLAETADFPERGFEWYFWQSLCRVEHLMLLGHQGGVAAVVFAPDGKRLVSAGGDRTARVWDATSGRELFCLRGHRSLVTSVAFAPSGQWLVTGSTDGTARIWDATSGRELRTLQDRDTGPVWAVAVTPDGKRIITGGNDGIARAWDAANGQVLLILKGHTALPVLGASMVGLLSSSHAQGPALAASVLYPGRTGHTSRVWAVAVTPDGQRLVTGSGDATARIWDAKSGRELLPPLRHTNEATSNEVTAVAVSANGQWLVTGTGPYGMVHLWDAATGRYLRCLGHGTSLVRSVAVTPDGKRVVSATGQVWDTASDREILTLTGGACVAISPDGQRLATGSSDGTARVWDTARLWGTVSSCEFLTLKGHTAEVGCVAVTRNGQRILTGSEDGTARLWDAASGRELLQLQGHRHAVMCVALTPDGQRLVTGGWEGTVKLWDSVSGRPLLTLNAHSGRPLSDDGSDPPGSRRVWSVAVTPDGQRIIAGGEDGIVRVWDAISGNVIFTLHAHLGRVFSVFVSADGQRLLTGSHDNTVKLWDAVSGREILTLRHTSGIFSAVASPDGQRIIGGGGDGTVKVWAAASGRELLSLKGHRGVVWSVAVTPDGQRILTGGEDGTARLWDAVSGRELLALKGHTGLVRAVTVTSDGWRLITGSSDETVKIWEAASPEQIALWTRQDQEAERQLQEAARRLAAWRRPAAGAQGFIQDWLVLAPLPLEAGQGGMEGLEHEQLPGEATLQPQEGDRVPVSGREYIWRAHRAKEPVLDFNGLVGTLNNRSVAYAVCYVISEAERDDLLLQVGSDDEAKVYLNSQEVYKYILPRGMATLDPVSPITLRKGPNVLVLKVVNHAMTWEGCARFVDQEGNPAKGLRVSLTPE